MSRRGTFGHPVDTWSGDLAGADAHARYHADPPEQDEYTEADFEEKTCEGCDAVLELKMPDSPAPGAVYFECISCGTEYAPDEVSEALHPEQDNG